MCVCVCGGGGAVIVYEKERFGVHGIHVCTVHDPVCLALYAT